MQRICSKCKFEFSDDYNYCPNCGIAVENNISLRIYNESDVPIFYKYDRKEGSSIMPHMSGLLKISPMTIVNFCVIVDISVTDYMEYHKIIFVDENTSTELHLSFEDNSIVIK